MKKICFCGDQAFRINDVSKGITIYSCQKTPTIFTDKTFKKIIKNTKKPCDFYLEVQIYEALPPTTKQKPKQKQKKKFCPYQNLYKKVNMFIQTKLYILFQEIEVECKKLNIPIYNHLSESMYEFCLRIQHHCLTQANQDPVEPVLPDQSCNLQKLPNHQQL